MWVTDVGNVFLATNNSIGIDVSSSEQLLKRHDTFETEVEVLYLTLVFSLFFISHPLTDCVWTDQLAALQRKGYGRT